MSAWDLPISLNVGGAEREIGTDFRVVLDIMKAFNDPGLPEYAKTAVMVEILYIDPIPEQYINEAAQKAIWFIDCGMEQEDKPSPRVVDWEKDAPIIFPAVNAQAGYEVRIPGKYMHWWTFYGLFMNIQEGLFSQVLAIRQKLSKGKNLEKWEQEFLKENKSLCALPELERETQVDEDWAFFASRLK